MRGGEQGNIFHSPPQTDFIRLSLNPTNATPNTSENEPITPPTSLSSDDDDATDDEEERAIDDELDAVFTPEFRLVNRDDPEAYSFNTPKYSAHKLPKDVVDASAEGEAGLREFMGTWREVLRRQEREEAEEEEGGEGS